MGCSLWCRFLSSFLNVLLPAKEKGPSRGFFFACFGFSTYACAESPDLSVRTTTTSVSCEANCLIPRMYQRPFRLSKHKKNTPGLHLRSREWYSLEAITRLLSVRPM